MILVMQTITGRQLWVGAHYVNGTESLEFVISDEIKNASVSAIWGWYCACSMKRY